MSKGKKRRQANKIPIKRCLLEHCANPLMQNPACCYCKKFIDNYKNGLTPHDCFWYCYSEEWKKKLLKKHEEFKRG